MAAIKNRLESGLAKRQGRGHGGRGLEHERKRRPRPNLKPVAQLQCQPRDELQSDLHLAQREPELNGSGRVLQGSKGQGRDLLQVIAQIDGGKCIGAP